MEFRRVLFRSEGSFSANHVRGFPARSAELQFSASAKGPPMACQAASHPETLRGQRYSMPCPTAKNWAPFVRGCAPEDAGANHDMRRVRLLTADGSSDDQACNSPRVDRKSTRLNSSH